MANSSALFAKHRRPPPAVRDGDVIPACQKIIRQGFAAEIKVGEHQVKAAIELLDGGATVPFIARYRKEATDGLDDIRPARARSAPGLPA